MTTKHEKIIRYITSLSVGSKISVRRIARELKVSEGTAYRAIKEAENRGIVSTIERVGTIRIEHKENFEKLTFAEVVNIIDGQVLGGRDGLHKTLNKFVIGAMKLEAMMQYTEPDSLLIVGNRTDAHRLALEKGAAVLITGGFDTEPEIKQLADQKKLPIISTTYDTYTVASMINRAIYDQLIKKEIILVRDILTPIEELYLLHKDDTIAQWYELSQRSEHTRFPVVSEHNRLIGVVTTKDIIGKSYDTPIERVMTKHPVVVQAQTSLAHVAHMMVWEGIEIVPVVDQSHRLIGIVSRQDVLKALQQIQQQPQVGETIDEIVANQIEAVDQHRTMFKATVIPQMTNQLGILSDGVFTALMTEASRRLALYLKKGNLVVENLTVYFIKPVQIDSEIIIKPRLLETGRIYAKIDVEMFQDHKLVGKGLMMAQLID